MHHNKVILKVNSASIFPNVVEYGLQVAKKWTYPLLLFDVKEIDKTGKDHPILGQATTWGKVYSGQMMQNANRKLKRLTRELRKVWRYSDYELMAGNPVTKSVTKINHWLSQTRKTLPNLVIIGRENDFTFLNQWLGTEESQIAENVDCPVLIIPKNYDYKMPKHFMYLMDSDFESVEKHLEYLVQLASPFLSTISVVFVGKGILNVGMLSRMHNYVTHTLDYPHFQFHNFRHLKSPDDIIPFAEKSIADVLAVPQRSKGFFERFYESDNTKTFILKPDIPVLVF